MKHDSAAMEINSENDKMITLPSATQTEMWPIDRFVPYVRNPGKNDAAVDRMCASIKEFGFKVPCLVRSDGEVETGICV